MEPLERELAEALDERCSAEPPGTVLVVTADAACAQAIVTAMAPLNLRMVAATTNREAVESLQQHDPHAIMVHADASDGRCMDLIRLIAPRSDSTRIIALVTADHSAEGVTKLLDAGASDVLMLPLNAAQCARRVQGAVEGANMARRRERQIARLQLLCRRLNEDRLDVAEQLDMVSRDLVSAYQDNAQRISDAAMISEFRTLLQQELDLEELLRTTLEYLLTKTGPTNAAVFLPNSRSEFALGAYVNYDCPRDTVAVLLDHLCQAICPQMARESELVSFDDADDFAAWIGAEAGILEGSQVVAFSCRRGGDCLGVIVLFRSKREPFADNLASILELLRPVVAEQIAQVIHVHHRASGSWPREAMDDEFNHESDDEGYTGLAA